MESTPVQPYITRDGKGALIIFDGVCNMCNMFVLFVIDHDSKSHFCFTANQSKTGQYLLSYFQVSLAMETIILVEAGRYYTYSTAVLRIFKRLSSLWKVLYVLIIIPKPIRDTTYKWIARNRYQWMGKREQCRIPAEDLQHRFFS